MKFGRYLDENKEQEWATQYMEYKVSVFASLKIVSSA
jgi:hypothetical protein